MSWAILFTSIPSGVFRRQADRYTLMPMTVAAILLAAGTSSRLGQPKQLLRFRGETLIERAIRLAVEAGAVPVFAVLGAHQDKIRAAVPLTGAIPVIHEGWEQGLATSIHAGLRALDGFPQQSAGAMLLGCDQPQLTAEHLRALLAAFCDQTVPTIVASAYAGVLGIPAVFPPEVFPELYALRGDRGAKALLTKPPCRLISLPFAGGEVDIDLPADLTHLD